jgi:hypothetical protein
MERTPPAPHHEIDHSRGTTRPAHKERGSPEQMSATDMHSPVFVRGIEQSHTS